MSYLVCEECGNNYELKEGKDSFSYEKCSCGGKLRYTDTLNGKNKGNIPFKDSKITCKNCGVKNPMGAMICSSCQMRLEYEQPMNGTNPPLNRSISWTGISIGFLFLLTTILFGVVSIFGSNIPQNPYDIPYSLLVRFGILVVILLFVSGLISSYVSGSQKFTNGIINGGLVGVILGLIVGAVTGNITSLIFIALSGTLAGLGGMFGTFLIRMYNKYR